MLRSRKSYCVFILVSMFCLLGIEAAGQTKTPGKKPATREDKSGNTPLILIVKSGSVEDLRAIIEKNVDLDYTTKKGLSALGEAFKGKRVEQAEILIEAGASPNLTGGLYPAPIESAISLDSFALAEKLLARGADPNHPGVQAAACKLDVKNAFTNKDSAFRYTFLLIENGLKTIDAKYDETVNFSSIGYPQEKGMPLISALLGWYENAGGGSEQKKKALSLARLDIASDTSALTPLHFAVCYRRSTDVQWLLDAGAGSTINIMDKNGKTPLWMACFKMDTSIARMLLAAGADPALSGAAGPALIYVKDKTLAKEIIEKGADVNGSDAYGFTPLLQAGIYGLQDLALFYIESGATLDARIKPQTVLGKNKIGDFDFYDCVCMSKQEKIITWAESLSEEYKKRGMVLKDFQFLISQPWCNAAVEAMKALESKEYKKALSEFQKALGLVVEGTPEGDALYGAGEILEAELGRNELQTAIESEKYKEKGFVGKVWALTAEQALIPLNQALPAETNEKIKRFLRYQAGDISSRALIIENSVPAQIPLPQKKPESPSDADFEQQWTYFSPGNEYKIKGLVSWLDGYRSVQWRSPEGDTAFMDFIARKISGYSLSYSWSSLSNADKLAIESLVCMLMAKVDLTARNNAGKNILDIWNDFKLSTDKDSIRLLEDSKMYLAGIQSNMTPLQKSAIIGASGKCISVATSQGKFIKEFQNILDK